jgi:two-component system, NtrC family, sensor kinase
VKSIGIKTNIIATLVLLFTLAIFCSDIVIIMFWQRGLMEAEVHHVQSYLTFWNSTILGKSQQKTPVISADLNNLCNAAASACAGVIYFDGQNDVFSPKSKYRQQLKHIVRLAAFSGTDIFRFTGASWGVITFTRSQLLVAIPVKVDGGQKLAGAGMVTELQPVYQLIKSKQQIVLWYLFLNVLFLTIIGFFRLHRSIVRPIERLVKISETYSGADGQVFFLENKGGEFGQLSMALNSLVFRIEEDRKKLRTTVDSLEKANLQLIKNQKEMIRAEKFAAIGRLSAGFAHEIGNPIGIVQGYLELLKQADIPDEERYQFSSRAIAELERISRLIRQLLDFSRSSSGKLERIDVRDLLDSLVEMITAQQKMSSISFTKKYNMIKGEVIADPDGLRQVFLNCLLNAVDAVREKGDKYEAEIGISCGEGRFRDDTPLVRISVNDNGVGIKKEDLEKIFDPFFTNKEPGKGTGLGLSVSDSIIEAAGGRMWVESEFGKGTTVNIELPTR